MSSSSRRKASSSPASSRAVAAEYNKSIRMTMGGTGKNAKIYSVADVWAAHYKPKEETKVFADAVGFNERLAHTPFRIPGREDYSLGEDPFTKFSGADVNLASNPPLKKKLLRGLPRHPVRRDGTPYWHFAEPVSMAQASEHSPEPKSACCYFNDKATRQATTVPNISVAILPPGEVMSKEEEEDDIFLFEKMMRDRQERLLIQQEQERQMEQRKKNLLSSGMNADSIAGMYNNSSNDDSSISEQKQKQSSPSPSTRRRRRSTITNNNSTTTAATSAALIPTRPQSAATSIAALELLEDTIEGAKHKTRDVFKESYTRLPKSTWKLQSVSKKDREKVKNDAASRIQKWFMKCRLVMKQRQERRDQRAEREEKHRRMLLIRGAREKLQRTVELYVEKYAGLRRRLCALTVCRALRFGCTSSIESAKQMKENLKIQLQERNREIALSTRRNFAATEIQRIWRGVRRRYVTKVMLYVFALARQTFEEEFFETTYDCWLYHFTFERVRREAATNIQRTWRKFIVRRDYGVATFLNAVDLPCPQMCITRRALDDVHRGRAADFEEAIFTSPPRYSIASKVFLERGKDVAEHEEEGKKGKMMSIRELASRLGEEPPVPVSYSKEFYNAVRKTQTGKCYPSYSVVEEVEK